MLLDLLSTVGVNWLNNLIFGHPSADKLELIIKRGFISGKKASGKGSG
jgi:hypothetical protein